MDILLFLILILSIMSIMGVLYIIADMRGYRDGLEDGYDDGVHATNEYLDRSEL